MQILRLDATKGHLKWTVVDVAKATSRSRVWLYDNFGKNKTAMLDTALHLYLEDFYGLSPERQEYLKQHGHLASLWRSKENLEKYPEIMIFYFTQRNRSTKIGERIRHSESRYEQILSTRLNIKGKEDLILARVFFHGLATALYMNREESEIAYKKFLQLIAPA